MEDKKLTICFLGTAASFHMLKWAKYFSERGHNVYLLSWVPALEGYNLGNIKLHILKKRFSTEMWPFNTLLNLPFSKKQVQRIIKKIKPDVLNAHYITSYGSLGVLAGFHPLVITVWGSDILITPKKFLPSRWAVKYFLKKADLLTCDAEHMKKAMVRLGASPSKIRIINFGIDTEIFCSRKKDKRLKEKLGFSGSKIIISLRNLELVYSIDTLIKAVPLVLKKVPDARFVVVGVGSQESKLKRMAEDMGVSEKIYFAGFIPNEKLPRYLGTADVYVSTSLSDGGIAASTAEAMSCGLPVIITDVADNKEWVKEGENGFLIPAKNHQMLARRIVYLLKNKKKREEIGVKAREIIRERNNYYKEMKKMEDIYYKLSNYYKKSEK